MEEFDFRKPYRDEVIKGNPVSFDDISEAYLFEVLFKADSTDPATISAVAELVKAFD